MVRISAFKIQLKPFDANDIQSDIGHAQVTSSIADFFKSDLKSVRRPAGSRCARWQKQSVAQSSSYYSLSFAFHVYPMYHC